MVTTAGVARNEAGQFFIGKRKASANLDSCWEFPGGKAASEEEPEEALKREYLEEFGVDIEVGQLLCTGKFRTKSGNYLLKAYKIILHGNPSCREHLEIAWKDLDEIRDLEFAPSDEIIIEALNNISFK